MQVIIIGGGIGGLCLANGLHKSGITVKVYERQTTPNENLAGYGLHINADGRRALQECLPASSWNRFQETSTGAGTQMFFRDQNLSLMAERDDALISGRPIGDCERRGIGRVELRDLILQGLPSGIVQWNKSFQKYEELSNGRVCVFFTDGTSEEGDVLVGADGARSGVRAQRLPEIQREDLGILAIAGRYILNEQRARELPKGLVDGSLNNIVPHGKGWMFLSAWRTGPNNASLGAGKGEDFLLWAYVVPKTETPSNVSHLSTTELQSIALQGVKGWSPVLSKIIQDADMSTIATIPLRSMPHLNTWRPSNVTVLGDAIHNMTPMAGVGANTALRDASGLAASLQQAAAGDQSLVEAIGSYENRMRQYANEAVALSRRNAESASSTGVIARHAFRMILRLAQASPMVMRTTIGKTAIRAA